MNFGEIPSVTRAKQKKLRKKLGNLAKESEITTEVYNAIVDIIEDDPTLYLDCMVTEIANKTGIHVSINYVSKLLKKKNYNLLFSSNRKFFVVVYFFGEFLRKVYLALTSL